MNDKKTPEIIIGESCDGFQIIIDGERWSFDQEDSVIRLVEVFQYLGYSNTRYEEFY